MKTLIEKITGRKSRTLPLLWSRRTSLVSFALDYYNARTFYNKLEFALTHFNELYFRGDHFDFKGVLLAADSEADKLLLQRIFQDTLLIHCLYYDNHKKKLVDKLDLLLAEGSYLYEDGPFNITIKDGDVVIDAGAWVGDFSSLAAFYGAKVYAFEPEVSNFRQLKKTSRLMGHDRIIPVQQGLSDKAGTAGMTLYDIGNSAAYRITGNGEREQKDEVSLTTLDDFVGTHGLSKIDFIKADIEGYERNLLKGARETLRTFAPKLSLCTYHYPDDPQVMAKIIHEANPAYTIVQMRHKLYAAVI
ncbi:FkbM family methyltransferase [Chitinophaga sp. G-6-1-13]|uniref:FkbM family methyltransferase n=1 Tax=Chitinophaga fulva TaxID=2728842 RepID=A0A848GJP7_9BACT|nr:FkbM family methyltransferase [Chitinophaga fulva]NML37262.1 FkbM family methyltransferase [Chitinophaga fulva]